MTEPISSHPLALLLCGSPSDLEVVLEAQATLDELGIPSRIRVVSAHRTPDMAADLIRRAESDGFQVILAFAGLTAHLAGVAAAGSRLPVIGIPLAVGPLRGLDAALATLQMPPGAPVAAVAIGGSHNAALLAARILGVANPEIRERLSALAERDRARYEPERIDALIEQRKRERKGADRG